MSARLTVEITSHFLCGRSTARVHLLRCGPPHGPAIVLLHGYGDGAYVWLDVIRKYHRTHALVAIDLPGHGRSSHCLEGRYSMRSMVDDLVAVIDQLEVRRFTLIGHSRGGVIALHLATERPHRVCGMIVVDTAPHGDDESIARARNMLRVGWKTYRSPDEYAGWLRSTRPLAPKHVIDRIAPEAIRCREDGLFAPRLDAALTRESVLQPYCLAPILAAIDADVLLIRGQVSAVLSAAAAAQMGSQLRRCQLRTVARAGHSVMLDNPEGFICAIEPFLQPGPANA